MVFFIILCYNKKLTFKYRVKDKIKYNFFQNTLFHTEKMVYLTPTIEFYVLTKMTMQ